MENSLTNWIIAMGTLSLAIVGVVGFCINNLKTEKTVTSLQPFVKPRIFAVFAIIAIALVIVLSIYQNKARGQSVRQNMILEATRITKNSEEHILEYVRENTENIIQKIVSYIGSSKARNEIILDALNCARKNSYLFVMSQSNRINTQDFYIPSKWLDDQDRPLLLVGNERLIITTCIAKNPKQNLTELVFSILSNEEIIGKLIYDFKVGSEDEDIHLTHFEKLGIICGYINMLKTNP